MGLQKFFFWNVLIIQLRFVPINILVHTANGILKRIQFYTNETGLMVVNIILDCPIIQN